MLDALATCEAIAIAVARDNSSVVMIHVGGWLDAL